MSSFSLGHAIPQLPSGNIDRTAEFCVERLGFEIVSKRPAHGFLIVRREAAEIHFWQAPDEKGARELGRQSSCYVRVANIQAFYEELKGRGAPFRYPLEKKPWGMNEMQIDDPYGNAIRFGEPIE